MDVEYAGELEAVFADKGELVFEGTVAGAAGH